MSLDLNNLSQESLVALESPQLIQMVLVLHEENLKLKKSSEENASKNYDLRLETLERELNMFKQYNRRDNIEIVGIDPVVRDEDIEEECIKILKAAKVKVGNKFPTTLDIQAAHRKGKKGTVIMKFVNRKFAYSAISNRANLKDSTDFNRIFINTSLCPEFGYLNFAVRKAKENNEILFYKM